MEQAGEAPLERAAVENVVEKARVLVKNADEFWYHNPEGIAESLADLIEAINGLAVKTIWEK